MWTDSGLYSAVWVVYRVTGTRLKAIGWVRAGNEEAALANAQVRFGANVTVEETEGEWGWVA